MQNNMDKVKEVLEKEEGNDGWLTIGEVAEKAGLSRTTASKFLYILVAEGKAEIWEVGPARLFRLKKNISLA